MAVKRRRSQHLLARDAAAAVDVERGEGGTQLRLRRLFTGAGVKGRHPLHTLGLRRAAALYSLTALELIRRTKVAKSSEPLPASASPASPSASPSSASPAKLVRACSSSVT